MFFPQQNDGLSLLREPKFSALCVTRQEPLEFTLERYHLNTYHFFLNGLHLKRYFLYFIQLHIQQAPAELLDVQGTVLAAAATCAENTSR